MLALAGFALALDFLAWQARQPAEPHPEPAYRFAAELYRDIAEEVRERPGVVRPFVVGESVEGRPIWGFRVGDPARPPRVKLLLFAQIHPLEWVPSEVAVDYLREAAGLPPAGVELTILPSLNPDGRNKVETDLRAGENRYRRGNAHHVDLNRDFAVNREAKAVWKAIIPKRYATSPAALSQPESQALDRLAASEGFASAISLHAFGGFVYYPWAGLWERPDDWTRFQEVGVAMQAAMGAHAYKPRQLSRWGFFFRGHGMELDHLYQRYGILSFLVETTRSGLSPFRPAEWGNRFRTYNPREPERHVREAVRLVRGWVGAMK